MQVQLQKQGWEPDKSVWIEVPRIAGESGTWNAGDPIRQLSFSTRLSEDPHAPTHYLAVRTSVAVHVLRIALNKGVASWDEVKSCPSRFNFVASNVLSLDLLGAVPPAHVAFNPAYDKQVATTDQYGTWRVWELSRSAVGRAGKPLEIASGATADTSLPCALAEGSLLDDGWGRITWAGTASTIIVVSRKAIGVYDVEYKPIRLVAPDMGIAKTPHWILDMQMSPGRHPVVFVLTSTHIICMRIRSVHDQEPTDYDTAGAYIVFRTPHFRDPEDITLTLSTFLDGEGTSFLIFVTCHHHANCDSDIVLILKSSLSLAATMYRCFFVQTSSLPFLSISDPAMINLPENPSAVGPTSSSLGIRVHPAEYGDNSRGASGLGQVYRDSSVRFYAMTMLSSNMSIFEKTYFGLEALHAPSSSSLEVLPVNWYSRLNPGVPRLEINFVVNDQHEAHDGDREVKQDKGIVSSPRPQSLSTGNGRGVMVYERAYNHIARTERHSVQDFFDALKLIRGHFENQDEPQGGHIMTMLDLCNGQTSVGDLDEATAQFRQLLLDGQNSENALPGELDDPPKAKPTSLAVARVLGLPTGMDPQPDLMAAYDSIMNQWLAPLSQRVAGRVRLAKEQLARRVAAEVCLASCGLKRPWIDPSHENPYGSAELPETQQSSFLGSSQSYGGFPTPSPTATPSLTTMTSLSSHPSTMASPEYLRLQQYATFSSDKTAPAPLLKKLAKLLGHWSIGGNPDEYDWLSVQRQQEKEAEEDDEDLTPRQRARLKKRAERHLRKQRRETEKAASMNLASSQAPAIFSASQPSSVLRRRAPIAPPITPAAGAASQGALLLSGPQATQSQTHTFPTSQVVPGRFGGRGQPPKKKKKRNVGF